MLKNMLEVFFIRSSWRLSFQTYKCNCHFMIFIFFSNLPPPPTSDPQIYDFAILSCAAI